MRSLLLLVILSVRADAGCVPSAPDWYECFHDGQKFKVMLKPSIATATIYECQGKGFNVAILPQIKLDRESELHLILNNCELGAHTVEQVTASLGAAGVAKVTLTGIHVTATHLTNLSAQLLEIYDAKYVAKDALNNLSSLKTLILKSNVFERGVLLDKDSFQGTENLQKLEIWTINMTESSAGVFRNLSQLEDLKLLHNDLKALTVQDFTGLVSLKTLYINNSIKNIENGTFHQLPRLERLTLARDAPGDSLALAPRAFAQMDSLKKLQLSNCNISEVPGDLLQGSNELESLSVINNSIKTIPVELLSGKKKLKELRLSSNRIEGLHLGVFAALEGLAALYLDRNLITEVPANIFAPLTNMEVISLEHNQITNLPEGAFSDTNVKTLILSDNKLRSFAARLPRLLELRLGGNQLSRVPEDWKVDLPLVNQVDLSRNLFRELLENETTILPATATVDLSYNNITAVRVRPHTKAPTYVLLNNPLTCDCTMYRYIEYIKNKNTTIKDTAKCIDGRNLTDVDLSLITCNFSCPRNCSCTLTPFTKRFDINCKTMPSDDDFADMNRLKMAHYELAVTSLALGTAPPNATPPEVKILNLSHLKLTSLPKLSPHLLEIDLSYNNLTEIPTSLLTEKGPKLNLGYNPFICDCDHEIDLTKLIASSKKVALETIFCHNTTLSIFDLSSLCAGRSQTVLAAVLGFIALATMTVMLCIYKNVKCVKRALASALAHVTASPHAALVANAYCDLPYLTREFLPLFESEKQLKLCVTKRDFNFDDKFSAGIEKMVSGSRKIIIILSVQALESKGEVKEFEMVLDVASKKIKPVLLLQLDDISGVGLSKPLEDAAHNKGNVYRSGPEGLEQLYKSINTWNVHRWYKRLNSVLCNR